MNDITINGLAEGRPVVFNPLGVNGNGSNTAATSGFRGLPGTSAANAQTVAFGTVVPIERANLALNELVGPNKQDLKLRIELDEPSGRFVILSVDKETGEIVRQFPLEEILGMIAYFREIAGLAVDDTV